MGIFFFKMDFKKELFLKKYYKNAYVTNSACAKILSRNDVINHILRDCPLAIPVY